VSETLTWLSASMIGLAGWWLIWVALSGERMDKYGREALIAAGGFFQLLALINVGRTYFIDIDVARWLLLFGAVGVCILVGQAMVLSRANRRVNGR